MKTPPIITDDDYPVLMCPVCGGTYNHIQKVGTQFDPENGDEAEIYPGTALAFKVETGARRSALRIDIRGECGHRWNLILQQNTGQILVESFAADGDTDPSSLKEN